MATPSQRWYHHRRLGVRFRVVEIVLVAVDDAQQRPHVRLGRVGSQLVLQRFAVLGRKDRFNCGQVHLCSRHDDANQRLVVRANQLAVQRFLQPVCVVCSRVVGDLQDGFQCRLQRAPSLFLDGLEQRGVLLGKLWVRFRRRHNLPVAAFGENLNELVFVASHKFLLPRLVQFLCIFLCELQVNLARWVSDPGSKSHQQLARVSNLATHHALVLLLQIARQRVSREHELVLCGNVLDVDRLLGAENLNDEAGVDAQCPHGTMQKVSIAFIRISDQHLENAFKVAANLPLALNVLEEIAPHDVLVRAADGNALPERLVGQRLNNGLLPCAQPLHGLTEHLRIFLRIKSGGRLQRPFGASADEGVAAARVRRSTILALLQILLLQRRHLGLAGCPLLR
eukprot:m.414609 g.414609  ORF g.414609 m.414609 type:complete len:396 (+) comp21273_c0_seq2:61-1248(+)